jgi:hypothetical protein
MVPAVSAGRWQGAQGADSLSFFETHISEYSKAVLGNITEFVVDEDDLSQIIPLQKRQIKNTHCTSYSSVPRPGPPQLSPSF